MGVRLSSHRALNSTYDHSLKRSYTILSDDINIMIDNDLDLEFKVIQVAFRDQNGDLEA